MNNVVKITDFSYFDLTGWVRKNGPPSYKYLISLFFCRFFEIFSKQPTKWYKCKTLVSWISDLYHSLTSKAAKMSINTAISEKVIKLYKGHFFAIKISFLSFKRVVNSYFIKEIHIEQILNDISTSDKGTKSLLVTFVNSALPHHSFWKLLLKIKVTMSNDYRFYQFK